MLTKSPEDRAHAVAIAKDVLERIRLHRLNLLSDNGYVVGFPSFPREGSLQENIDLAESSCEVCALGAMFLSYARLYNNIYCQKQSDSYGQIIDKLENYFYTEELELSEHHFERRRTEYEKNDEEVMIDICENIIDNNGVYNN